MAHLPTCHVKGGCMDYEQFIKERIYLHNVSPRTVEWYRESFKWLATVPLTDAGLKDLVIKMRESGLKPTSCNNRIRAINAYLKWAGTGLALGRIKEPHVVLPTLTDEQVKAIVYWKPRTATDRRLHALVCTLLDCGLRIGEALTLTLDRIDFDNLLLTVCGKGDKQRVVPFSYELRRILWKYRQSLPPQQQLLFATSVGTPLGRRDVLRGFKRLCKRLGFKAPRRSLHAIRHSFACGYIRRGGSQFHLMKMLGHTSLEMTRRYVNLQTEDLRAVHDRLSLLSVGEWRQAR
jgi:integrase/recombinase XerD